jgi:ferredoxin
MMLETTLKIRERVRDIVSSGAVDLFIGYEAGVDALHITPCFVQEEDEVDALEWNLMCINNLSTYLKRYQDRKIGLLVKGCDSRSIVELLKLHQVQRDNLYILGMPCTGILDPKKVMHYCATEDIASIREEEGMVRIERKDTAAETEPLTLPKDDLLYDKCLFCSYPNPVVYDELLAEEVTPRSFELDEKFDDVERMEMQEPAERLAFWTEQLNKCIRCYACKNVCPMCFCAECLWEKRDPQWVTKFPNQADTFTFHMIRAYHMIGRCTGCMECERVCPVDIPLGKIFKKIEKDCLELFDYQPGVDVNGVPPLSTFDEHDQMHDDLLR